MNITRTSFILTLALWAGGGAVRAQSAGDAVFRQGSELYRAGNCAEAVRQLAQSKGVPRASLLLGRCYLDMNDFAKARTALQEYNQATPGDEEATILLARAVQGAGDAAQAVSLLEDLKKKVPASLAVQSALADAYARSGKAAQAEQAYRAVLAVQPGDIAALSGLAALAAGAAQWNAAIPQYKKVLDLSPDNFAAAAGMGKAHLQLGQLNEAISPLQRAIALRPDDWELTKLLAGCFVKTSKWTEAIQTLEFNSLAHPEEEDVTAWMAEAFSHGTDPAHAEQYYRAVLQKASGNFTARLTLATLLYDSKRWKDAKEQYVLILKAKPNLYEISDRVGQMAEQDNNLPEAIQYYSDACRSPQATTAMKLRLARLYFRTDDMEHALPALENVQQVVPDNREVKMMLTQVAVKTKKMEDAVRYATELLPGDPNNVMLLRLLGEDALKRNNDGAAADFLERALAVDGKDREIRFELVTLYTNNEFLDRLPRAFDLMNEFVSQNPDDVEGYLLLANLYRRKSDPADAHAYFQRAFNKMPAKVPPQYSWAYSSFGLLLFSEGKFEEALVNQLKALDLNPADANAQYNVALTYLKLKRKDDVNGAREKLSQMNAPELLVSLDDQIQRSRINEVKK